VAIRQNVRLFFYLFIRFVGSRIHLIPNTTLIVGIIGVRQVYTTVIQLYGICIAIEFRDLHGVRLCRRRRCRRRLWRQWTQLLGPFDTRVHNYAVQRTEWLSEYAHTLFSSPMTQLFKIRFMAFSQNIKKYTE